LEDVGSDGSTTASHAPSSFAPEAGDAGTREAIGKDSGAGRLELEFSISPSSGDEDDAEVVHVIIDLPAPKRASRPEEAGTSGNERLSDAAVTAPAVSEAKSTGADSSSSSDSSSYFVRDANPDVVAYELGAKPTALRLGGNIVKSL
jgi:hypothetical protein